MAILNICQRNILFVRICLQLIAEETLKMNLNVKVSFPENNVSGINLSLILNL